MPVLLNVRQVYVKDELGRACTIPPEGMYAGADGKARQCNTIIDGDGKDADDNPLYASFKDNTGPVSDPNGCPLLVKAAQDLLPRRRFVHRFVMRMMRVFTLQPTMVTQR